MDWPDFEGWFDSLNLEPKYVGISLIIVLWTAFSLLDDPFNTMEKIPLFSRIVVVVLIGPITYLILKKMLD
jgi:hypothetical protein